MQVSIYISRPVEKVQGNVHMFVNPQSIIYVRGNFVCFATKQNMQSQQVVMLWYKASNTMTEILGNQSKKKNSS